MADKRAKLPQNKDRKAQKDEKWRKDDRYKNKETWDQNLRLEGVPQWEVRMVRLEPMMRGRAEGNCPKMEQNKSECSE